MGVIHQHGVEVCHDLGQPRLGRFGSEHQHFINKNLKFRDGTVSGKSAFWQHKPSFTAAILQFSARTRFRRLTVCGLLLSFLPFLTKKEGGKGGALRCLI
jgi:hypothetical protein